MNKSLALIAALPALLLTGCASGPATTEAASTATVTPAAATQSATPKPTPTTTKTATREEQMKEIYLEGIYKSEPALRAAGADLVDIGQGFCKMYDGGAKGSDINKYILTAAGWAYTVGQLASVHGAAVGVYCPEHIDKMGQ
jgi:hypothetical protein